MDTCVVMDMEMGDKVWKESCKEAEEKEVSGDNDNGLKDVIDALGHEISEIRVRALQSLQRKLDHGLIPPHALCKRIDLINRLTSWLLSTKWTEHELLLIVQFLTTLCQHQDFTEIFLNTPLLTLIWKERQGSGSGSGRFRPDTKEIIDRLFDSIHVQSFDIHCQGLPEIGHDNSSAADPNTMSRYGSPYGNGNGEGKLSSLSTGRRSQEIDRNENVVVDRSKSGDGEFDFFFSKRSGSGSLAKIKDKIFPRISTIPLDVNDRRVLSSTVESLLSRNNEGLVHLTTCFVRDVLLNDFPVETFVQECSVSQSLVNVVQENWNDPKLNYAGFQSLYKLSTLLRQRFGMLNSSEFYLYDHAQEYFNSQRQRQSGLMPSSARNQVTSYLPSQFSSSTDYLMKNLCQLIKTVGHGLTLSHTLTKRNIHSWIIMDNLCYTLNVCLRTFAFDRITLAIQLEEILLDLCRCIPSPRLGYYEEEDSTAAVQVMALILISLLNSFEDTSSLAREVRQGIWNLAMNPGLGQWCPSVVKHFLEAGRLFEPKLTGGEQDVPVNQLDAYGQIVDKTQQQQISNGQGQVDEEVKGQRGKYLTPLLHSIQNATDHLAVRVGIDKIWERVLPLVLNSRTRIENIDEEIMGGGAGAVAVMDNFRLAFSRFISVEPTCAEDEDLLARVLDLFAFLLTHMRNAELLKEWIVPWVKGSPLRRVLLQRCCKGDGTLMSTVVRSVFNFYAVLEAENCLTVDTMWELIHSFAQILHKLSMDGFTSPAIVHSVFQGLTNMTAKPGIVEKLMANQEFAGGLFGLICDAMFAIEGRASTYRNIGSILYGATSALHLLLILKTEGSGSAALDTWQLIQKSTRLFPFLWASQEPRIRAVGFQICSTISATQKGTIMILMEIESPILLWKTAYKHLIDSDEAPFVRAKAGEVLVNLLNFWDDMEKTHGQAIEVPKWEILKDILEIVPHIHWQRHLSPIEAKCLRNYEKDRMVNPPEPTPLITPKVLSSIAKIVVGTVKITNSASSTDETECKKIAFPETCGALFRVLGNQGLSEDMDSSWWKESCNCLNILLKSIISLVHLEPTLVGQVLLADKFSLAGLLKLFQLQLPQQLDDAEKSKCESCLQILWMNTFTLLTILSTRKDGADFQEFEQMALIHGSVLFPAIVKSLHTNTTTMKSRDVTLQFCKAFLQGAANNCQNGRANSLWQPALKTHGESIHAKFMNLVTNSLNVDERSAALTSCHSLYRVAPDIAKNNEDGKFIGSLIKSITEFGAEKSVHLNIANITKKNVKEQEEIICTVQLLGAKLFESESARSVALRRDLPSAIHLIYKIALTNQVLLHAIIECLVNYTNDHPKGAHSLTLTTGIVGVPARKTPSPNSIFTELLSLLHKELENVDKNISHSGPIISLLFALIKNSVFSNECRNCLVKINTLSFIKRLHLADTRKWKNQQIKLSFLNFILDLSVQPDMQLFIAKLPECVEILVLLAESDPTSPISGISLQILRNLSFHNGNRIRLLNDGRLMLHIVQRLKASNSPQELEVIGVMLWASVANSEKGKVLAKQSNCGPSICLAIQRLKKLSAEQQQPNNNDNKAKAPLESVINLLEKVLRVLDSSSD